MGRFSVLSVQNFESKIFKFFFNKTCQKLAYKNEFITIAICQYLIKDIMQICWAKLMCTDTGFRQMPTSKHYQFLIAMKPKQQQIYMPLVVWTKKKKKHLNLKKLCTRSTCMPKRSHFFLLFFLNFFSFEDLHNARIATWPNLNPILRHFIGKLPQRIYDSSKNYKLADELFQKFINQHALNLSS